MRNRKHVALVTVAGCALWALTPWSLGENAGVFFFGGWASGACFALYAHWRITK